MNDPDASRELITLYQDCEWRTTRLQILSALSRYPTQRSLEFLFKVAQEPKDIPIAQAAVSALGQSHHPLAARFLVNFFSTCSEFIRPSVVGALGQCPDRTLAPDFIKILPVAITAEDHDLVKQLILTLGELKVHEALPFLIKVASDTRVIGQQPQVALSALLAIGKVARDPQILIPLERHYQGDAYTYQLFTLVKTQVQFRSQWKLEDYLSKLFTTQDAAHLHRTLPFELTHFKAVDVKEGLKLFKSVENFDRLNQALARLDFDDIAAWYKELIDWKNLTAEQLCSVLKGLENHYGARFEPLLASIHELQMIKDPSVYIAWLTTLTLSHPNAQIHFKKTIESNEFYVLQPKDQTQVLNQLINFGLIHQTQESKVQSIAKILDSILENEKITPLVQARALRGLGHLGVSTKKALQYVKSNFDKEELRPSCLSYLERCPDPSCLDQLIRSTPDPGILRTLNAQNLDTKVYPLSLIQGALQLPGTPQLKTETRLEALRFLSTHPHAGCLPQIIAHLFSGNPKGSEQERLALQAVIALKTHASIALTECDVALPALSQLLGFAQESLSGRTLDTLTGFKSLRAKRILVDYLRDHSEDLEVCDKLIRSLEAPESGTEYFVGIIDTILNQSPQHPRLDGLLNLRERFFEAGKNTQTQGRTLRGADIQAIDRSLIERIAEYESLDDTAKTALRSAELPHLHPTMFDEFVDKSSSLVEYCKAIDIQLEKTLGKKTLFPKLEQHLHEFQNALHNAGLGEEYPSAERVLQNMGLEKHFSPQSLPVHKMSLLAQSIRNGRIVNDRFKTLDGLRAWAVILLIFARKIGQAKPLILVKNLSDEQVIHFCKRLIALQEVRNPAAHRQTVVQFKTINETRTEALSILGTILKAF